MAELLHAKMGGDTIDVPVPNLPVGTAGGWERVTLLKDEAYNDGEANRYHALGGWLILVGYMVDENGGLCRRSEEIREFSILRKGYGLWNKNETERRYFVMVPI
ncbi:hypothetical protein HO133_009580 [Letharia lupina]|uniref:Uncharacterized protein n=1 Tax=Letharia lupina TaxID=560253 RepID=A0A8H6CLH7_9LECA|nr:uncharacterized protein HO133_009580 [Letharia lupina]KAF6225580.1 hypothetical protein HO133_009580 [Letharia lupina]